MSGKPVDPATGTSLSMITDTAIDFHWFPLDNPGIVSIPLAFLLGWLGTVTSKEPVDAEKFAEMEVRSLTGAGAEKAVQALETCQAGPADSDANLPDSPTPRDGPG